MEEAAIQPETGGRFDKCTRCLQPVPDAAPRCPSCGQPHRSRRWIPLAIGTAGLMALIFVMALMYYAAWRADMMNADVLPDEENQQQQDIMVKTPDDKAKAAEPDAPPKKPPLNDK